MAGFYTIVKIWRRTCSISSHIALLLTKYYSSYVYLTQMYGSQWRNLAAACSLLFLYYESHEIPFQYGKSHETPHQYYRSRENPYQVLQVMRTTSEHAMKLKDRKRKLLHSIYTIWEQLLKIWWLNFSTRCVLLLASDILGLQTWRCYHCATNGKHKSAYEKPYLRQRLRPLLYKLTERLKYIIIIVLLDGHHLYIVTIFTPAIVTPYGVSEMVLALWTDQDGGPFILCHPCYTETATQNEPLTLPGKIDPLLYQPKPFYSQAQHVLYTQ